MNLLSLNSPLPKPWLEISCNKLTANEIVTPVGPTVSTVWASNQNGGSVNVNGAPYANLCTAASVVNPNYNLVTNLYTAPVAQYVSCSLGVVISNGALATAQMLIQVVFRKNGVDMIPFSNSNSVGVAAFTSVPITHTDIVELAAGDTLGYSVLSTNASIGATLINASFSGCVI